MLEAMGFGALPSLRSASMADARILWLWANDQETRAASIHPQPIPWESHSHWLATVLRDPLRLLLIGETQQGVPIGVIRFDRSGRKAVASVTMAPEFRSLGLGTRLIRSGCAECFKKMEVECITAYVKKGNKPSARAFSSVGFRLSSESSLEGEVVYCFELGKGADSA